MVFDQLINYKDIRHIYLKSECLVDDISQIQTNLCDKIYKLKNIDQSKICTEKETYLKNILSSLKNISSMPESIDKFLSVII